MSYTYLLDAGEESSAESFSDIPASVLLKLSLIVEKSCSKDSGTASCQDSQSGMMSEPSMQSPGGEKLMSSAGDFHALKSASSTTVQAADSDSMETILDSGRKCFEWFAKLDPQSFLWKTRQLLLFEDLDESLVIWPKSGTMEDGICFQENMLAPLSFGNDYLYLRSPMSSDGFAWTRTNKKDVQTSIHKTLMRGGTYRTSYRFQWASLTILQCAEYYETMMDWPKEWTGLKPLVMDKFQQWLNSHGKH